MSLYTTQYDSTATDGQGVEINYNGGMCATITVNDSIWDWPNTESASVLVNEADLTFLIGELTALRDAILSVKRSQS